MQINQSQIAKILGVSTYSISVAFGRKGRISEKTRQMILEEAPKYGYRPNKLAAGLRAKQTNTVGVIWDFTAQWTGDVASALMLMDRLQNKGLTIYQFQNSLDIDVNCRNIEDLICRNVDAIIIRSVPDNLRHPKLVSLLESVPTVIAVSREDVPSFNGDLIIHDRYQAIRDIVAHFAKTGRKKPAITLAMSQESNPPKYNVFADECRKHGIDHGDMLIDQAYPDRAETIGKRYIDAFAKKYPGKVNIDSLFCPSDTGALFLMQEIKRKKLRIPDDLAIVGFNNLELGQIAEPALATCDRKHQEISNCIEELLQSRTDNPDQAPKRKTVHIEFINKESAGKKE